jgi:hypothetical protein
LDRGSPCADRFFLLFFFLSWHLRLTNLVLEIIAKVASSLSDLADEEVDEAIWKLLLSAAAKIVEFVDGKVEGSRPDNKIQSPRSPRSAPIDEG